MTQPSPIEGSCLCGAVRFEITPPTKWCAHCHCSLCRRAHGAAFVTWFGVERPHFVMTSGDELVAWYRSTVSARRGFCSRCGSTLFFESDNWPGEIHIVLANMEDPIDRAPAAHVYYDTHVMWVELGDNLRRLGGRSGTEELDAE